MGFRIAAYEKYCAAVAEGEVFLQKGWSERKDLSNHLYEVCPTLRQFEYALETKGDVNEAIATHALHCLRDQGYCKSISEYITGDKLRNSTGTMIWALEWVARGVLGLEEQDNSLKTSDKWHRVELCAKLDAGKRQVDTEFFLLNSRVGEGKNTYDDREKLHLIWQFPESKDEPDILIYAGFGTNEPYDYEHPEGSELDLHRPRFYIYDNWQRYLELRHAFTERDIGEFDWNWQVKKPIPSQKGVEIQFVDILGSRLCLADRKIVSAAAATYPDRDSVASQLLGSGCSWMDLGDELQKELRKHIRLKSILVSLGQRHKLPQTPPTLQEIISNAVKWYTTYFYAWCSRIATSPVLLEEAIKIIESESMEPTIRDYYKKLLNMSTALFFDESDLIFLPATIREVLQLDLNKMNEPLKSEIAKCQDYICTEIATDIYFEGQHPQERGPRLLLGVKLAVSQEYGDLYGKFLNAVRCHLDGEDIYGTFDLS